ncbi:MAG: DUF494 domain-containing protein [Thiofilum sp.]|uniref:DUF494 family protein n=1 Tax=Thiofilum sp. TaxID=2212733 RepID=UPI0026000C23|nr:DUF494 domain-containing protein [Thiofilum sp.]MBK8452840.1 DUF494 domain-containing protein [Thiofilum sp.]
MKENTLDVLFYLFDTYPSMEDQLEEDREVLQDYLQSAGFHTGEILRAFDWLESLGDTAHSVAPTHHPQSLRVFTTFEQQWLDIECQDYLLQLEKQGLLTAAEREQVIDRVIALQDMEFDLARLQWVVQMVVMNRPEYPYTTRLQTFDNTDFASTILH